MVRRRDPLAYTNHDFSTVENNLGNSHKNYYIGRL